MSTHDPMDVNVVEDFGASPFGGTSDSTTSFQNALNSAVAYPGGIRVFVPAGVYNLSSTIKIVGANTSLVGAGPNTTVLNITENSLAGIVVQPPTTAGQIPPNYPNLNISNFTLTRTLPSGTVAMPGADGIVCNYGTNQVLIENVTSSNHYYGFNLGPTLYSTVLNCIAYGCQQHGFYLSNYNQDLNNPGGLPFVQWSLINTYSANNYGHGYLLQSSPFHASTDLPAITPSPWIYPYSFSNRGHGVFVNGVQSDGSIVKISDFVMIGAELNHDNDSELFLETGSGLHKFIGCLFESAGNYIPIPPDTTKPSNEGHGAYLKNNSSAYFTGCSFIQNSFSGVYIDANDASQPDGGNSYTENTFSGCRIIDNNFPIANSGRGPTTYSGIDAIAGSLVVSGCRIGTNQTATPSTLYQQYAIAAHDGSQVVVSGSDLSFNVHNPTNLFFTQNPNAAVTSGNRGWVSRASGVTGFLAANQTSLVVSHTLSATPICVCVTPPASLQLASGATSSLFVSNVTSTQFTINLSLPLPTQISFFWTAWIEFQG